MTDEKFNYGILWKFSLLKNFKLNKSPKKKIVFHSINETYIYISVGWLCSMVIGQFFYVNFNIG